MGEAGSHAKRSLASLARVPRIAAHWATASDTERRRLFLLSSEQRYLLQDAAGALEVLRLVDGKRSMEELQALLGAQLSPAQVARTVFQLEQLGILTCARVEGPEHRRALFDALGWSDEQPARVRFEICSALSQLDVESDLTQALEECGFELTSEAPLGLLVSDDALSAETAERVARMTVTGSRCLLVQPTGPRPSIGPLLGPGQPKVAPVGQSAAGWAVRYACYGCLRYALRQQRSVESYLEALGKTAQAPLGATRSSVRLTCALAAHYARSLFRKGEPALAGHGATLEAAADAWQVLVVALGEPRLDRHRLRRRPQCETCGNPMLQRELSELSIELREQAVSHWKDGGYRLEPPELMLQRLLPLVSSLLGPIAYLQAAPSCDAQLPVFFSGFSVCPRGEVHSGADFTRVCAGKGVSGAQARVSALAEAIERLSSVYRGDEPVFTASLRELGVAAVPPAQLELFSQSQREGASHEVERARRVPQVAHETSVVCWTSAWSLTYHRRRYVPLAYCFAEAPNCEENSYSIFSSNGSAAGSCLEEALLQGLLELIERDAVAIWWYNQVRRPSVRLTPQAAEQVDQQRRALARLGFELALLDLTHDLGIPVTAAVAHRAANGDLAMGFGCHLQRTLATQRALTELNQVLDRKGGRQTPWTGIAVRDFLRPSANQPAADVADSPEPRHHADLKAALCDCIERLARCGMEVMAVNKTRPELELAVAQVIVPGLRHIWPRYGPGRLYQVPVQLQWLTRPLGEHELNPQPLLL